MQSDGEEDRCPYCRAVIRPVPVLYGVPTPQLQDEAARREVRLKGRVRGFHDARWACNECGREW